MKYCPYCGSGLNDRMVFCPKCGNRFQDAIETDRPSYDEDDTVASSDSIDNVSIEEHSNPLKAEQLVRDAEKQSPVIIETAENDNKKRNQKRRIVFPVSCCAIIAAIICFIIINGAKKDTKQNTDNTNLGVHIENNNSNDFSITDVAHSVLFIEIYDESNRLIGTGSGFVIDNGRYLVTNYHVIEGASKLVVSSYDGLELANVDSVAMYDDNADLALLPCPDKFQSYSLPIGDSRKMKQGDAVYAAGYPLGITNTLSDGIISSMYSEEHFDQTVDLLQITAAISPGSSGGALLNENGEVIGVVCASYMRGQNMNIAVASNELLELISNNTDSEIIQLRFLFDEYNNYGATALNTCSYYSQFLSASGRYVYYIEASSLKRYDKETGYTKLIGSGNTIDNINVYKNRLYYNKSNSIFECDLEGNVINSLDFFSYFGLSDGYINRILLAENMMIVDFSVFNNSDFSGYSLYFIDLNDLTILKKISGITNISYYQDVLLAANYNEKSITCVDLLSLEDVSLMTSCFPAIVGISDDGMIYYTDVLNELSSGIYYMNLFDGKEYINRSFTAQNAGRGYSYACYIIGDNIFIISSHDYKKDGKTVFEERFYHLLSNGELHEVELPEGDLANGYYALNCIDNNRLYGINGSTYDVISGEFIGKWVF